MNRAGRKAGRAARRAAERATVNQARKVAAGLTKEAPARPAIDIGTPERAHHGAVRVERERTRGTPMRVRDLASCPIDLLYLARRLDAAQHTALTRFRRDWEAAGLTDFPHQKWSYSGSPGHDAGARQSAAMSSLRYAMAWLVAADRRLATLVWRTVVDERMPVRLKALAVAADRLGACYGAGSGRERPRSCPEVARLFAPRGNLIELRKATD